MNQLPRRRRRRPQPTDRFTRVTRKIIYKALRARLPVRRALDLANVTMQSYAHWLKLGEDPRNTRHALFRKIVKSIETEKEKEALQVIELAQKGGAEVVETRIHIGGKYGREITRTRKQLKPQWAAAAWWLERTKPDEYGGNGIDQSNKSPEDFAREIRETMQAIDETVPDEGCCLSEIQECD